jgi:hypothetical protein
MWMGLSLAWTLLKAISAEEFLQATLVHKWHCNETRQQGQTGPISVHISEWRCNIASPITDFCTIMQSVATFLGHSLESRQFRPGLMIARTLIPSNHVHTPAF